MQALKRKIEEQDNIRKSDPGLMGHFLVPENVQQERYQICLGCEHFYSLLKNCKICGCVMPLKTRLKNQSCPIKKWDKYVVDGSRK